MQITCPLTNVILSDCNALVVFQDLQTIALHPIFSISNKELTDLAPKSHTECKLALLAVLHRLGIIETPQTLGQSVPAEFFSAKDSLPYLKDLFKRAAEILAAYTELPETAKPTLVKFKPYAISSIKKVSEILKELENNIKFSSFKFSSKGVPLEALLSNSAMKFYEELTKEERIYTLDKFAKENKVFSEVAMIKELEQIQAPSKEVVSNVSLAIMTCVELLDTTSVEDISLIYIFKAILEGKSTIELTRSKLGNLYYWIGLYKAPSSIQSAGIKSSALERLKALTKGKGNLTPTLANNLALSISAEEL